MKFAGGLVVGTFIGLLLMGIFGLSFLAPPGVDPVSAYCRGWAEGYHYAYLINTGQGIDQETTDGNEQFCMTETPFALDGWGLHGPLLP